MFTKKFLFICLFILNLNQFINSSAIKNIESTSNKLTINITDIKLISDKSISLSEDYYKSFGETKSLSFSKSKNAIGKYNLFFIVIYYV